MKEEDIRLIKQEIKNNRKAGECGLASNNEKFEWAKTADALEKLLDYITNLQEENVVLKSQLLQDNKSYHNMQDRIKKAIELLNDWNYLDKIDCYCEPKEVIEILQGKSDE